MGQEATSFRTLLFKAFFESESRVAIFCIDVTFLFIKEAVNQFFFEIESSQGFAAFLAKTSAKSGSIRHEWSSSLRGQKWKSDRA